MAHYKQAVRYNEQNKPDKSRAHLLRALDYVSFGTRHHKPYDPDKPAYVSGNFDDTDAYQHALEQLKHPGEREDIEELKVRELPTYYTMRNPPIHALFEHPLVNVWVESQDENGAAVMVNVYRDVDTEAHTYLGACSLVDLNHKPVMETIKSQGTFEVRRTNGTTSNCVAFTREFMHGFLLCFAVDEDGGHGRPITVRTGHELAECPKDETDRVVRDEKRRRRDWTKNKMYRLDVEGYRKSLESDRTEEAEPDGRSVDVHRVAVPLVNVWLLSDHSDTLTNIYRRDELQLYTDSATGEKKSKRIHVERVYAFLSRVDTTRQPVDIANLSELDALLHQKVHHTDSMVLSMQKSLEKYSKTGSLVMPPFCVFYEHEFGSGRNKGRLVTIVNINWYDGKADQVTLTGEWVNVHGVGKVRVFTTENEFIDAKLLEIYKRGHKEDDLNFEEKLQAKIRKKEREDDLADLKQQEDSYGHNSDEKKKEKKSRTLKKGHTRPRT